MTLHYSRARMDATSPVRDVLVPTRTRPKTAGQLTTYTHDESGPCLVFYDSVTNEPLGGAVRRRPNTARPDIGGILASQGSPIAATRSHIDSRIKSEMSSPVADQRQLEGYVQVLEEADAEVEQMVAAER